MPLLSWHAVGIISQGAAAKALMHLFVGHEEIDRIKTKVPVAVRTTTIQPSWPPSKVVASESDTALAWFAVESPVGGQD